MQYQYSQYNNQCIKFVNFTKARRCSTSRLHGAIYFCIALQQSIIIFITDDHYASVTCNQLIKCRFNLSIRITSQNKSPCPIRSRLYKCHIIRFTSAYIFSEMSLSSSFSLLLSIV